MTAKALTKRNGTSDELQVATAELTIDTHRHISEQRTSSAAPHHGVPALQTRKSAWRKPAGQPSGHQRAGTGNRAATDRKKERTDM